MSWGKSVVSMARTGRPLGERKKTTRERKHRSGANTLSEETVALIKWDLLTMTVSDVSVKHNLRHGRVKDIHQGITYAYVKAAA